ncbi:MAG: UPF0236 family protein [Bacteroidota bacterium]
MGKKKEFIEVKNLLKENPQAKSQATKDIYWHTTYGDVAVSERTFIINGKLVRPFSNSANVACRSYSPLLERRITDFGSDVSFGKAVEKLNEHYGLIIPESSIRLITQKHGVNLLNLSQENSLENKEAGIAQAVVQTDGCMIPKVEFTATEEEKDLRKTRTVAWKEVRLSLGYIPGVITPVFEATSGTPEEVGQQLLNCANKIGYGKKTQIHGVGDGAKWIAEQIESTFGCNGSYLIDFYHLCEYFYPAAKVCSDEPEPWYKRIKQLMLDGKVNDVLQELLPYIESPDVEDEQAPVRKCFRYIKNRPGQFNYPQAIEKGLPIGSGKIESANSYVIQARMKITGAWWKVENIDKMLSLLTCKQNGKWNKYWQNIQKVA